MPKKQVAPGSGAVNPHAPERPRFAVIRRLSALARRVLDRLAPSSCSCGRSHSGCCAIVPVGFGFRWPCSAEAVAVAYQIPPEGGLWMRSYCATHAPEHEGAAEIMGIGWMYLRGRASARRAA